jgi:WD40 repeat protein
LTIVDTSQGMHEDESLGVADDTERDRPIDGVAVSPRSPVIAAASQSGRIEAWTLGTKESCFRYDEKTSRFQGAAFSPDGRRLATAGQINARTSSGEPGPNDTDANGLVIVFDIETGAILWRREGMATGIIRDLAFSPDGQLLATADNTNSVTLWDVSNGEILGQLRGHSRLVSYIAFSPDGRKLASSSWDSTVIVWDVATHLQITTLQGHMRSVLCVAFSPDGRRLATSSEDQTVRLWDTESGQEVLTLRGHTDIVTTVAFSPDGNRLLSAGADGTVQIREAVPETATVARLGWPMHAAKFPRRANRDAARPQPGSIASAAR